MFFNVTSVGELELAELIQCRFLPILSLSHSSHILVFWVLVDTYESQLSSLFIFLCFKKLPHYLKRDQARSGFFYKNKQIWQLTFVAMYQKPSDQNMKRTWHDITLRFFIKFVSWVGSSNIYRPTKWPRKQKM